MVRRSVLPSVGGSVESRYIEDTAATLRFAQRVSHVRNTAKVNKVAAASAMIGQHQSEVSKLRDALGALNSTGEPGADGAGDAGAPHAKQADMVDKAAAEAAAAAAAAEARKQCEAELRELMEARPPRDTYIHAEWISPPPPPNALLQ